jgi:hypothetical protein
MKHIFKTSIIRNKKEEGTNIDPDPGRGKSSMRST